MISSPFLSGQDNTLLIDGPTGKLEVLTHTPALSQGQSSATLGVICHPHPLYQGTMHNKVVTTLAKAYDDMGFPSVRFNYRGVGESEGVYGQIKGECEDLRAVIAWAHQYWPGYQLALAGFSFGAFIAASVCTERTDCESLISIAPAVNHAPYAELPPVQCPWLVMQGGADEIVPAKQVEDFLKTVTVPYEFELLPNVGHFFHGQLVVLKERVLAFLRCCA